MLFLFSQPYLRSVPGLKKNLCCGDMTLIFLHTPSLQDCDETVLDKLDSLNDSEPKVRRFRAKPCCSLSSCEDYPLDERFWSPFLLVIIELKQQRRRRVRKRHSKSEFALPQTLSLLFLELNSNGLHQSSGKENCCLVFPSSTKRKIRKFHVVVVQPRLRKMYKKAWWTCKVVFWGESKPIAFLPFSLTSPSSLLKLPNDGTQLPWPWTGIRGWHPVWPEKTAEISWRHTGLPAKWRQRNERRYSIVMTCIYPDLDSVPSSVWKFCLSFSDVISRWN